ncbi:MAG: hypothetical protein A2017_01475 [Lentisphaerae bacterium GWF2_44_16]|nr:MAG: hypothetical protein A2017_01475 [Lentisphaerae bacterium GWF2_44_16]
MQTLKLPAKLESLHSAMEFLKNFFTDCRIDSSVAMQIELAVEEALVNIISYAYHDNDGDMELSCDISTDRKLTCVISDSGTAFDSLQKEEPDLSIPVEERAIGGLGIFLVRKMMDDVQYKRENDRNILTLMKKV